MIDAQQLMGIPEIVRHLNISRVAVYDAIERGELPPVRVGGRQFVQRSDVEAFQPRAYAGRPGTKPLGRAGRPKAQSEETGQEEVKA